MFTNEFEYDHILTTILDDTGNLGDVRVYHFEDYVYMVQIGPENPEEYEEIILSPRMFQRFLEALSKPEGVFDKILVDNDPTNE